MNRSVSNEQILEPREKQPVLHPLRRVVSMIFLAGVLPGLISLAVRVRFGDVPHKQEPLHNAFELVGSCIALGVALLLALRLRHDKTSPHLLWVVAALVAMGLVDGVHAVAPFGIAWSWLRHGATFIGGVVFALVWLPLPAVAARRPLWFTAGLTALAIAASLAVWYDPTWLPAPWGQAGYTLATKATNAAGGVGFMAAALFFLRRYLRQTETQDLLLAGHTLLFGTASLLFGFSHLWGADWWLWHGFRLLAYAVLLVAAHDVIVTLYRDIARHAQALEARKAELRRIEWLLAPTVKPVAWPETSAYEPPYGDLTALNTARLILDSVGKPMLTDIVKDYLDLLGTSAAVYEKNGDYALGLFSSGWCRFLDQASRGLCGVSDNREALACGRWHCHESCWTHASKQSIETGQPIDIECAGGLHLYAIPIRTGAEIIGSLNIGYGDPPTDPARLQELAGKYGVSYEELSRQAKAYESRPPFIIELAKARLQASARLIAEIVERKRAEQELRQANLRFRRFVEANIVGILIATPAGEIIEANDYYLNLIGYTRQELEQGQVDWRAVTPPEWLPADEQALRELRDRGSCTPYEKEYLRRDGRRVSVFLADTMLLGPGEQIAAFCLDMSERKRMEAALRQRAEEVERLLEVVPAAIFISSDPACRRIVGNQQANQIFEAKPDENVSASTVPEARRYYGPDGREITANELPMQVAAATNQEVRDAEMVVRSASGRVLSLLGNAVPLRNEHGEVRGCIGAFLDITERKRIERALQRNEAALKKAQRIAHLGSWELNLDKDEALWSDEMFRIFAWPVRKEPVRFSTALEATYPDDRDPVMIAVNESLSTRQPYDIEHRIVRPDGSVRWIQARGEVVLDETEKACRLVGTTIDITAQKLAQAALQELNERLNVERQRFYDVLETLPIMICLLTRDYHVAFANRAFRERFGESGGRPCYEYVWHFTEPGEFCESFKVLETGKPHFWHVNAPDGTVIDVYDFPFTDVDGSPLILEMDIDVTEQKRTEAEVNRLNVELEQRVEARTAELRAANAELESFAYAVSHDLRAPLRAMSGFSQALQEDYGEHLDGEARSYLDQISLASRRMSELIDGLLTLSRSTRGELKQEALDISALSERLLAELNAADPARRVAWTVEPGMQAQGDATMIEIVMRNLIDNAWKYTGKTPDAAIRVYSKETNGQRCFCVSDNGAGFDMAHVGKFFQPFQRLHRQEEFPGIGIGLATVQRIVHRHGGAIWANGAPGQGATFCFTLHNPSRPDKETS